MIDKIRAFAADPDYREALGLPDEVTETYQPLAQGEYNINYQFSHPATGEKLVLRINTESQMHLEDQIGYEANGLKILEPSGRTPRLYYVDRSSRYFEHGALVMSFIPGRALNYEEAAERRAVAQCLADIHSLPVKEADGLIAPADLWKAMLEECEDMFRVYCQSDLRDLRVESRIRALMDEGWRRVADKGPYEGYRCCINTELNNTNFLIDDREGRPKASLVDWEKPLYGDPAQDLGHFLTPTTTFWKTDTIFDQATIDAFMEDYLKAVDGRWDTRGLRERTMEFLVMTCLRGLTWCAMAWVQYQDAGKTITNDSTRVKLDAYLSEEFIGKIETLFGI